jgi:hypothetical protein
MRWKKQWRRRTSLRSISWISLEDTRILIVEMIRFMMLQTFHGNCMLLTCFQGFCLIWWKHLRTRWAMHSIWQIATTEIRKTILTHHTSDNQYNTTSQWYMG